VKFLEVADHPALADAYPALSVCAAAVSGGEVSVGCQASTTLGVCQRRPKTDPLATVEN
jgi:hypothetical protein